MHFKLGFLCFFLVAFNLAFAQDTTTTNKNKLLKIKGAISLRTGVYESFGIEARQDNFQYLLQSNVNFNFFNNQVVAPFSATVSQQNQTFLQPFNQYGISPTYKNITLHIGFRNLNYNKYTLGGHNFLGIGADYNYKKIRASGMYGRFRKAINDEDGRDVFGGGLSYRRMGYGAKLGYGTNESFIDVIVFSAEDEVSDVNLALLDSTITPEANFVYGFNIRKKIGKNLFFKGEYGRSAYSANTDSKTTTKEGFSIHNNTNTFFQPRLSSSYQNAGNMNITFNPRAFNLTFDYEYIGDGYRTLGAFFFQDDIENLTIGGGLNRKKWSANTKLGIQRNNLNSANDINNTRFISSFNGNYRPNQKHTFGLNYSNFSAFTTAVQRLGTDSLDFFQVNHNANASWNYLIDTLSSLSLNLSYQNAFSRTVDEINTENATEFISANVGYLRDFKAIKTKMNIAFMYNIMQTFFGNSVNYGPSVSLTRAFFKEKFTVSNMNSFQAVDDIGNDGWFFTTFLRANYKLSAKQSLGWDLRYNIRSTSTLQFSEIQTFASYTLNF